MSGYDDILSSLLPKSFGVEGRVTKGSSSKKTNYDDGFDRPSKKKSIQLTASMTDKALDLNSKQKDKHDSELMATTTSDTMTSSNDKEEEETAAYAPLPVSHEMKLVGHTKAVSGLSIEPSGSRVATGAYDDTVRLWDFNGMDSGGRSFRNFEPCEGNKIRDLHFSISGDQLLVIPTTCQAKLYDRNGASIAEFSRGDVYIRDLKHTSGHVAMINCCQWHPIDKEKFITASVDSTIRLWDVNRASKQQSMAVYRARGKSSRTPITAVAYHPDGSSMASAAQDGTISLWSVNDTLFRPVQTVEKAHTSLTDTSAVIYTPDGNQLVSRGGDDTVKLWDTRRLKEPVNVAHDLPSASAEGNLCFSPDGKLVLTGLGTTLEEKKGRIAVLDRSTLKTVQQLTISEASVIRVLWHERINQILATCSNGQVSVLYSDTDSNKGALLCAGRTPKRRAVDEQVTMGSIITPNALPMYGDEEPRSLKRIKEKARKDPRQSKRPDLPISAKGRGVRVGSNIQQFVALDGLRDKLQSDDPREALLKYAKDAEANPRFVGQAYKKNQPKPIFENHQEDVPEMKRRQ